MTEPRQAARELLESSREARRAGDIAGACALAAAALDAARAAEEWPTLVLALAQNAQCERDLGHLQAARTLLEEAERTSRINASGSHLPFVLRHLADIERELTNYASAVKYGEETLELLQMEGPGSLAEANTHRVLALASEGLVDDAGARQHWQAAQALYRALNVHPGVEECGKHLRAAPAKPPRE